MVSRCLSLTSYPFLLSPSFVLHLSRVHRSPLYVSSNFFFRFLSLFPVPGCSLERFLLLCTNTLPFSCLRPKLRAINSRMVLTFFNLPLSLSLSLCGLPCRNLHSSSNKRLGSKQSLHCFVLTSFVFSWLANFPGHKAAVRRCC